MSNQILEWKNSNSMANIAICEIIFFIATVLILSGVPTSRFGDFLLISLTTFFVRVNIT